jgi:hypothetical protein
MHFVSSGADVPCTLLLLLLLLFLTGHSLHA